MINTILSQTPDDLLPAAGKILAKFPDERVFAFYGSMGAGKTTFIKAFCKALGSTDVVSSPSFSLVNEYEDKEGKPLFHFDFYRIKKLEEVFDMGFEEYVYSGNFCFLEWPERISELLPETYVYVHIGVKEKKERKITYFLHNKQTNKQ